MTMKHVYLISFTGALLKEAKIICYYKGESISNQPIPFLINRDGHNFHALFEYM